MVARRTGRRYLLAAVVGVIAVASSGCGKSTPPPDSSTKAPTNLSYSTSSAVYIKGSAIAPNTPSSGGGAVASYAVAPALPAGLSLDTTTGIIRGTPSAVTPATSYVVTATNAGGSTTVSLSITINDVAPASLGYSTNPAAYTMGAAIPPNMPHSTGGAVVSYSVAPPLPPGLTLNAATGMISGTPTALAPAAAYSVTATNTGGTTQADLSITVNDAPPANLTYSTNPAVYTKGVAIAPNTPSHGGGAVTSYSVSPALPAGLGLNTTTGVITGTPTALSAAASYVVTATNTGGTVQVSVVLAVNDVSAGSLTYSTNPAAYTKGVAIAPNVPTSSGGAVVSYSVAPPLPAGLSLNTTTGVITGTPTAVTAAAGYLVTATNTGGTAQVSLIISVNDVPPANLTYSTNPAVYTKGAAIAPNTPSSGGGAVTSYSVSPALPAGLNLNTTTGVITGTPAVVSAAASYVVTASNSGGSTTASLSVTVRDVAPTNLTYSTNPAAYTKGAAIAPNTPSNGGGAVTSYSVSPALPAGLSLNTSTG
ncbi:MAG TPA: putative Ig domain-containing protein, partial [Myxococcaceae bacterium]|nr:putative Ig domain-containing protein [Myxococcaceae bacterium]